MKTLSIIYLLILIILLGCNGTISQNQSGTSNENGLIRQNVEKTLKEGRPAIILSDDSNLIDKFGDRFYVAAVLQDGEIYPLKIFYKMDDGLNYVENVSTEEAGRLAQKNLHEGLTIESMLRRLGKY